MFDGTFSYQHATPVALLQTAGYDATPTALIGQFCFVDGEGVGGGGSEGRKEGEGGGR